MKAKKLLSFIGIFIIFATALTSCTKSFCSVADKAQTMFASENYVSGATYADGEQTKEVVTSAESQGMLTPSTEFNDFIEKKLQEETERIYQYYTITSPYKENIELYSREYARGVALFAGGSDLESMSLWYNFDNWYNEALTSEEVGLALCPDSNYIALYKKTFNALVSSKTTCISPVTAEYNGIVIEGKTWKQAFSKGIIEGLLVYPISWLLYTFTIGFSNGGIALGAAAMLSILVVTIIVRLVLILLTFKQTLSQQKMTALQPEIVKIQNKYPNAQTNEYEKQKLAQEQMALYKKNHVSPFGMFIVLLIQFPIFIAVWSAMQGSSILMSGEIFGLSLASSTGSSMINFKGPWYVAWVVFILMAAAQFLSMKIPQWHQKKKAKSYEKVGKNPTQDQQSKTNNMVSNIMVIMIILMGLQLPIAMSVYWFIGALISLLQSLIMQHITEKQAKKKSYKK